MSGAKKIDLKNILSCCCPEEGREISISINCCGDDEEDKQIRIKCKGEKGEGKSMVFKCEVTGAQDCAPCCEPED